MWLSLSLQSIPERWTDRAYNFQETRLAAIFGRTLGLAAGTSKLASRISNEDKPAQASRLRADLDPLEGLVLFLDQKYGPCHPLQTSACGTIWSYILAVRYVGQFGQSAGLGLTRCKVNQHMKIAYVEAVWDWTRYLSFRSHGFLMYHYSSS